MTISEAMNTRSSRMPPEGAIACLLAALICTVGMSVDAVEQASEEKKPDWAALEGLIFTGDYTEAAAVADGFAKAAKRKSWAADFLPRTIDFIRARMWQGLAEHRLGELDAADATFTDAQRAFKDRDFQRLLSLEARQATAAEVGQLILLELTWIELLNAKSMVILDRIRYANLARFEDEKASAESTTGLKKDVARWLDELELLQKNASKARESLAKRLDARGSTVAASPRARALVGRFWPALIAGTTSFELSKLPFDPPPSKAVGESPPADPPPPTVGPESHVEAKKMLGDAIEHFQAAAAALDEAIAAAAPKGAGALKPDSRSEAALMEVELLASRAAAEKEAGDLLRARDDLGRVFELQREISGVRKKPYQESHPDLLWPLVLVADIEAAESRRLLADGEAAKAQEVDTAASKTLARAAAVPMRESHPLRGYLEKLTARLERQRTSLHETIPRSDQANKAARRLRGAIDATAIPGLAF